MEYRNRNYYVEVKDKRYINHLTEGAVLRKLDPPECLKTQYQVINETEERKN